MDPSDAPGVARCVYRCHGYTYLDPVMYRPRLLRGALRSGLVHAVVAVTPEDEIVGHIALSWERAGDLVPEGGKLVVDPRYRGHHLAERLAEERAAVAAELGLSGVWCECVTNHPYSQKEVLAGGGAETGLLIGATPSSVTMAALGNTAQGRHSLLAMWTPVAGIAAATVHVPGRHVTLLDQLAQRAGVERKVLTATGPAGEPAPASLIGCATTRLSSSSTVSTGLGHLRVHQIGSDLLDRVADELDGLSPFDLAVVHLDLPISDPAAAKSIDELESLGFFWAAWLPCFTQEGDALRLQRIADRPVDVDHIVCASEAGEQLRDLVVPEWHRIRRGAGPVGP